MERDDAVWATLPSVGLQEIASDTHCLDLRNCPYCHTTLARRVLP